MATRIGGARRKTRYTFKKDIRRKGKISISNYLQKFNQGDRIYLDIEPAVHKGTYCKRFLGKMGIIGKQAGRCYEVMIKDNKKNKILIVHPVHMKRV